MGYLGLVGSPNPCDPPILPSPYGAIRAFRGSPFGFAYAGDPDLDLIPYEIITHPFYPSLFRAVVHAADTITIPSSVHISLAISLDDSTIVCIDDDPAVDSTALRVLTRSGTSLSLSGSQQSHTTMAGRSGFTQIVRIDSSHFARGTTQTTAGNPEGLIEFFSVSGGTISLMSSTTFPAFFTPPNGPPPSTSGFLRGDDMWPIFHSDGSGWLLGLGGLASIFYAPVQIAHAYTLGGGISASYWGTASGLAQNFGFDSGIEGSTECVFWAPGPSGHVAYYWDGSGTFAGHQMGPYPDIVDAGGTADGRFLSAGDGPPPGSSYLELYVGDAPPYFSAGVHESLILQSGTTLTEQPISVLRECPEFHPAVYPFPLGPRSATRHGPGDLVAETYDEAGGDFVLLASTWV